MVGDNGATPGPSGDVDEDAEDEIGETADQNFTENQNQGGDQHASEIGARANQSGRWGPAKRGQGNHHSRPKQYPVPTRRSTRRVLVVSGWGDDVSSVSASGQDGSGVRKSNNGRRGSSLTANGGRKAVRNVAGNSSSSAVVSGADSPQNIPARGNNGDGSSMNAGACALIPRQFGIL